MTEAPRVASRCCPSAAGAEPVVIGVGCAGWLHRPDPSRARGRGVVLCPPFGHEGLSAYRPLRDFARRLAAAGLPVLRFDYPGAGESAGEAEVPPSVAACIAAAGDAAGFLRRQAAIREIAFAGCRYGALVAALAAAREPGGTAALALLAPPISGRTHARELRLLAQADGAADALESGGFPLSGEFLAELATHHLRQLDRPPARRAILLAAPHRVAPVAALARGWMGEGGRILVQPCDGLARLLAEAHAAEAPEAAFAAMEQQLLDQAPPPLTPAPPAPGTPHAPQEPAALSLAGGIVERVVRFGPDGMLAGTWTLPARPAATGTPALLISGTGANMRAGNGRLSVLLAREAARRGIPVLRYDSRGVGDSENPDGLPPGRLLYSRHAIEDGRHALDWLAAQGHGAAIVAGSCAGAYVALHLAMADPRIRLAVPLNLQRFLWRAGRVLTVPANRASRAQDERLQWRARRDALQARAWPLNLLRTLLPPHVKHAWTRGVLRRLAAMAWRLPRRWVGGVEAGRVRLGLESLAARGTPVVFIYSADDTGLDEFETHLGRGGRRLARLPGFSRATIPGADHSLRSAAMRSRFLDLVLPRIEAAAAEVDGGASPP